MTFRYPCTCNREGCTEKITPARMTWVDVGVKLTCLVKEMFLAFWRASAGIEVDLKSHYNYRADQRDFASDAAKQIEKMADA